MRVSGSDRVVVPRASRMNFLVRLIIPWRLPAWAYITLPVPVILKRFFAPDFVFSLGIWLSSTHRVAGRPRAGADTCFSSKTNRHGSPRSAGRFDAGGLMPETGGVGNVFEAEEL